MEQEQAKRIIEALLFSSDKPLDLIQIKEVLEELDTQIIKSLIRQLRDEYTAEERSFNITEVAGGYRISTDPQYASWLQRLYRTSRTEKLSHPSLETLAIVAYRQPITRLEIEDIRGVNVEGVLKALLEKSLVRICGRKKIPGRPFLYGSTKFFLEFFGLQSLNDLPKLEEFEGAGLELQKKDEANVIDQPKNQDSRDTSGGKEDGEVKQISQENRPD